MKSLPASALATHPAPTVSAKYQFIPTTTIIERFAAEGWTPVSAQARANGAFGKHLIDFRNDACAPVMGTVPRIILVNSHDGSSAARVMAGMFRFVCSNGLVVGTTFSREAVRHTGDIAADLISRMQQLARTTTESCATIERWSRKDLTRPQREEFARFATHLRWGDARLYEPEEVLQVRRAEDDRGDLWSVFNRVQENAVRGGLSGLSRVGRAATSRPISGIDRTVAFNEQLWALADEAATTW